MDDEELHRRRACFETRPQRALPRVIARGYVLDSIKKNPHPRPSPGQALRSPHSGRLEGRTAPIQPVANSFTASLGERGPRAARRVRVVPPRRFLARWCALRALGMALWRGRHDKAESWRRSASHAKLCIAYRRALTTAVPRCEPDDPRARSSPDSPSTKSFARQFRGRRI